MLQSKPRLIFLIVIFSGLVAVALFTVLLMQRPGDEVALDGSGELTVPTDGQALAGAAQIITDQRFIDGATVTLVYPLDQQFVTDSERFFVGAPDPGIISDGLAPEDGAAQPVDVAPPVTGDATAQPADAAQPVDPNAVPPTATPDPGNALGGVPATVNTGNEMIILIDYTVAAGDTLYSISTRRDTSMALMAMYGIDANDMVVGRPLRLPIVNTAYCAGFRDYHLVVESDNVFRIAQVYGTTNAAIQQANALGADFGIRTNTVLCIP